MRSALLVIVVTAPVHQMTRDECHAFLHSSLSAQNDVNRLRDRGTT